MFSVTMMNLFSICSLIVPRGLVWRTMFLWLSTLPITREPLILDHLPVRATPAGRHICAAVRILVRVDPFRPQIWGGFVSPRTWNGAPRSPVGLRGQTPSPSLSPPASSPMLPFAVILNGDRFIPIPPFTAHSYRVPETLAHSPLHRRSQAPMAPPFWTRKTKHDAEASSSSGQRARSAPPARHMGSLLPASRRVPPKPFTIASPSRAGWCNIGVATARSFWEQGTPMPCPDVHLPHGWLLVSVPPTPLTGQARMAEIMRCWQALTPKERQLDMY